MTDVTHGAALHAAPPADRAGVHTRGDRSRFEAFDGVLAGLFERALKGEQLFEIAPAKTRTQQDVVVVRDLSQDDRDVLDSVLARKAQESVGAWYMPVEERMSLASIDFAYWVGAEPRFSVLAADTERAAVALDSADAVVAWAALDPVMDALYLPVKLRSGYWLGDRKPELMAKDWVTVDHAYGVLGIDPGPLKIYKDGARWADLTIDEVIAARQALVAAWAEAPDDVGQRCIALIIGWLADRYYAKAKDGRAQRTKVLNKALEKLLTGVFGGDWLTLVSYLGEQPHESEQVATAVEPTQIIQTGAARAQAAAEATGVSVDEIKRIMGAYWGDADASPVERRIEVIREWWPEFDRVHAQQCSGMPSLWGLLGEFAAMPIHNDDDRVSRGIFRTAFSSELLAQIDKLWETQVDPRFPQALVSDPSPYTSFAEVVGVAARFWQGVALTCWFICEGPYSRTDIGGMPNYYDREIAALNKLGCAIDFEMFKDLQAAEKRLTERREKGDETTHDVGNGLEIMISISMGPPKMDGFERLNDVVTRYRGAWTEQYFESYLAQLWESDLRSFGDAYHRYVADKGKAPTVKQLAKLGQDTANRWFGGRLDQLTAALGLPQPEAQTYNRLLPRDVPGFIDAVRKELGGIRWEDFASDVDRDERERPYRRGQLAEKCLKVMPAWEATGEIPPYKGNSWAKWELGSGFDGEPEQAWEEYTSAIAAVLARGVRESRPPAAVAPASNGGSAPQPRAEARSEPESRGWRRLLGR